MTTTWSRRSKVIAATAACTALVLGGVLAEVASASSPTRVQRITPVHAFARNIHGQTYGSGLDATTYANTPDLILAWATNGKEGYVLRSDLYLPSPSNPTAALAAQNAHGADPRVIPVFRVDGTTQIGVFVVSASSAP